MNFKNDDKLNREHFADFLIEIITNNKKYKRESDSNSFVLAIDSSWGTGKTTFLNMLENKMNSIENNNYTIINYNAWKSDAWKNPFETLMYTILENKAFNAVDDNNNLKEIGKDLKEVAKNIGKGFMKKQLSKIISEDVVEALDKEVIQSGDCKRFINNKSIDYDFFKEYEEYNKSIESMKKNLKKVCEKTQIVVFIDELDRCKPTFAIELLEMIKHLFDVENMVFVFALDISQLSYSVQSVYGNGIDSTGYLCRFFDYISKLPKFDTETYIEAILEKNKLINYDLKKEYNNQGIFIQITFSSIFKELANLYNLSLRDINTIYSNFLLFEKIELSKVRNIVAYELYLLLLIMKYKDPKCFEKIFINKIKVDKEDFIEKAKTLKEDIYKRRGLLEFIIQNDETIEKLDIAGEYNPGFKIRKVDIQQKKVTIKKNDSFTSYDEKFMEDSIFCNILFYDDIMKWEEIKNLHIKDFIHRKLEMFDFSWKEDLEVNQEKE